jgi:ATP-dependent Lon protease
MVAAVPETETIDSPKDKALRREANMLYGQYVEMSEYPAQSIQLKLMASENNGFTADTIAQNSGIDFKDKAKLLMQLNPNRRLESVVKLLRQEVEMLKIESKIQEKTRVSIDQNQKDYYLREQMKAIREKL